MSYFLQFLKNAKPIYLKSTSSKEKLFDVCFSYLVISIFFSGFIFWYPIEFGENLGLYNKLDDKNINLELSVRLISALAIAPLLEEIIFRYPLGYFVNLSYFKWVYYASSIFFGIIHMFNYNLDSSHYFFIVFITLPQTFAGLMLGFIRLNYGFWYAVLLHILYNLSYILLAYFSGEL